MADYSEITLKDVVVTESLNNLLREEFGCYIVDNGLDQGLADGLGVDFGSIDCLRNGRRLDRSIDPGTGLSFIETFRASPINLAQDFYKGVDLRAIYRTQTKWGNFALSADYTHVLERTSKADEDSDEFNIRDSLGFSGFGARSVLGTSLTYSKDDFSTTLSMNRRGSTPKFRLTQDLIDRGQARLGPWIRWNWTAQYAFSDNFGARLRVSNLFDSRPPTDDTFLFFDAPWYNNFAYGGAGIGREAAIELNYTF